MRFAGRIDPGNGAGPTTGHTGAAAFARAVAAPFAFVLVESESMVSGAATGGVPGSWAEPDFASSGVNVRDMRVSARKRQKCRGEVVIALSLRLYSVYNGVVDWVHPEIWII